MLDTVPVKIIAVTWEAFMCNNSILNIMCTVFEEVLQKVIQMSVALYSVDVKGFYVYYWQVAC